MNRETIKYAFKAAGRAIVASGISVVAGGLAVGTGSMMLDAVRLFDAFPQTALTLMVLGGLMTAAAGYATFAMGSIAIGEAADGVRRFREDDLQRRKAKTSEMPVTRDETPNEALLKLSILGNDSGVKAALESGADIDNKETFVWNPHGRTALMLAAQQGKTSTVELLMREGANTGIEDQKGFTAMRIAKIYEQQGVIHALGGGAPQPNAAGVSRRVRQRPSKISGVKIRKHKIAVPVTGVSNVTQAIQTASDYEQRATHAQRTNGMRSANKSRAMMLAS